MNTIKKFSILLMSLIMIIGTSCTNKKDTKSEVKVSDTVRVKTMIAEIDTISRTIDYTATLVAMEEVHLAPAMPGRIKQFNVEIGSNVEKGQVIAVMDSTNLEQSRVSLLKATTDFSRMDTLMKTKSISAQQYDLAKTAYEIAKSSYRNLLSNTQLRAPFSGVISGKYFEDGEIYSGTPVVTIGKPAIVSIVQINQLKALIGVSSSYFPFVNNGMVAEIESDIYTDLQIKGVITKIYPTIDQTTKTFTVEITIQNNSLKLRPGMFSKIKLNLGKGKAIMVPTIALIKQTGTNDMYVFVNNNGIAKKVKVITGGMIDEKTEIVEGIKENDEIIVVGQNKLDDKKPLIIENN